MARGVLTEKTKQIAQLKMGREITVDELRLMPYLMTKLMDNSYLIRDHIYPQDRVVLEKWVEEGRISFKGSYFNSLPVVTSEFYDAITVILKFGYCEDVITEKDLNCDDIKIAEYIDNEINQHKESGYCTNYDLAQSTLEQDASRAFDYSYDCGRYETLLEIKNQFFKKDEE